jgi:hypothetical protein
MSEPDRSLSLRVVFGVGGALLLALLLFVVVGVSYSLLFEPSSQPLWSRLVAIAFCALSFGTFVRWWYRFIFGPDHIED